MNNLTIGILLTDHVVEDLQEKHGDQNDFYHKIFSEVHKDITLKIFDVTLDEYPQNIDDCDGYLITGSKLSVYDDVATHLIPWAKRTLLAHLIKLEREGRVTLESNLYVLTKEDE